MSHLLRILHTESESFGTFPVSRCSNRSDYHNRPGFSITALFDDGEPSESVDYFYETLEGIFGFGS